MDLSGTATGISAASIGYQYSIALLSKVMDTQEQLAANTVEMISQPQPQLAKGQYIDTYA